MKTMINALVYLILAFAVIIHFLFGKYLFLLDYIPKINEYKALELFYGKSVPVYGGSLPITLLSAVIPAEIFQKLLLFLILFLSGYSMHNLASKFTSSETAQFYAGLLYMLNPYTYIRIVVGHWLILFAYAVLPLAVKYFIELLDKKDLRSIIKTALITTLVAFNSHTLFIAFLIFSILFLFRLYRDRSIISLIKSVAIAIVLFLALNTYWLIPVITAQEDTLLSHISLKDVGVFSPKESLFGIMGMYGFWKEGYIYAKDILPFWQFLFIAIFLLAIYGFISFYRDNEYVIAFCLVWLIGFALACGVKGPLNDTFRLLFEYTLLKGMRDTHKFVTMLVFSYSVLGALGLAKIENDLKNKKQTVKIAVTIAILLIPMIYSFTFFGFAGQIKPTDFPNDWYEVKKFLDSDKDEFRVLFFPWHLYMTFHWVPNKDKLIANPAPLFFDQEVISGKNIEIPGVYRQVFTPYQVYIDHLLSKRNEITNFGELVSILGVKYILLTKEADYKSYSFLFKQKDLKLVMETENFYVFKNKAFKGLVFSVDGVRYVKDWDELINVSKKEDITRRLYLIGNGKEEGRELWMKLKYKKVSPVKYIIKEKPLKYIILTEEYSKNWKLNGEEPLKAYGVVNAYVVGKLNPPVEIVYDRFYKVYLPSYVVSLITFLSCIGYLFYDWRREKGDKWTLKIENNSKNL